MKAKTIRRKKGRDANLLRNKKASSAELRGMTIAFVEFSGEHANAGGHGICLPIREPTVPCKSCAQHKCKVGKLELRIRELESRDIMEMAAQKFVEEARRNVKDVDWPSAKRKLLLLFHPDKMHVLCPASGTSFVKALSNHREW